MNVTVYIGFDSGEHVAWEVCRESLLTYAISPVNVVKLDQGWLRRIGLYRRPFYVDNGQYYDAIDGKPFSTQFSFTRFLVPCLQPSGLAVFCDSDFLWRENIRNMLDSIDKDAAVSCVKHDFEPEPGIKMRGQIQQPYFRKAWSSLMVWNCDHALTRMLTPFQVNTMPGAWLHGLRWLDSSDIGRIEPEWNWLSGISPLEVNPKAVHFTLGTPDMPGHEESPYADEWHSYC